MYMYSLGTSLTNNDVRNYNNYINAFNIAIGRQIYTSY